MTMAPTRSTPQSEAERPHRSHDADQSTHPQVEPDAAGLGHADAPRAGLRGVRTWRPSPRLLWTVTAVLLLAAVAVTATLGRSAWQAQRAARSR